MASNSQIDRAIQRCVRIALRGPKTPLAALATSLDELRGKSTWNDRDIRLVQASAYRRLILEPSRYSQLERA
jgi:hypothetical protein